jgi:hypothetical protein
MERHKKVDVKNFRALGIKAEIFYFYDYRHQFYYVLHNGDISVKSHCYPTKNICVEQLNQAVRTLWLGGEGNVAI